MTPTQIIWFIVGLTALGLGTLGIILPLLPTTPFILLAAFAFARSSKRFHDWLLSHRIFGPLIEDWREHGAVEKRTKVISAISMAGIFLLSIALGAPALVLIIQAIVLTGAATFVLSRPLPPAK